ncbi:MAG: lysophospholipid acyltransferase family protein [Candidatus Gastranaerophilales bacterium]|nr:lysophospholipid acyltransferase family protein [Candidatus Gastranaerophilales bacterium]
MIRSKKENLKISLLSNLAYYLFKLSDLTMTYKNNNMPKDVPAIYAVWHGRQCCIGGIPNRKNLNVLISPSNDGEIIARIVEKMGFSIIRGSRGRDGAKAVLKMVNALKEGKNIAFTVDGPKGPFGKVNKGLIKLAKMAQVPIIPLMGIARNGIVINFNSWDKYQMPIINATTINNYGTPIMVPEDATSEQEEAIRLQIEKELFRLSDENQTLYDEKFEG